MIDFSEKNLLEIWASLNMNMIEHAWSKCSKACTCHVQLHPFLVVQLQSWIRQE